MRLLTALFLSLTLAIASVSMAVARGQVPMGATVELCTEAGTVSVVLDVEGKPMPGHPHICPDCLSAVTAFDLTGTLQLGVPEGRVQALVFAHLPQVFIETRRVAPHARAPPALSV